jgi:nucleotide-binding universal stress UspA family protein
MSDVSDLAKPPSPHVLVAVDGTRASRNALGWAIREAAMREAELHILHVRHSALAQDAETEQELLRMVDESCASSGIDKSDIVVRVETAVGQPLPWILAAAEDADLLVVGSHHHSQLGALFLGSTSQCLCVYSKCPVVVVHAAESPYSHSGSGISWSPSRFTTGGRGFSEVL